MLYQGTVAEKGKETQQSGLEVKPRIEPIGAAPRPQFLWLAIRYCKKE
jgi:hypothetical protein